MNHGPPVPGPMEPRLYLADIRHVRSGGSRYRLRHRTYLWLVDLGRLPRLPRPLRPLARFEARDHFGGRAPSIRAGLDAFLAARDAGLPPGSRVLMLAHARVLGHVFNPLTVYWCHGPDGSLRHVVAEVHNTYGERHCYLLPPETALADPGGRSDRGDLDVPPVPKEFYVSPFLAVEGAYRMQLPEPGDHLALTVRLAGGTDGARLTATVRGERRPAWWTWPGAGLLFEAVGDHQLARFKADPANRGRIMDRGLWSWTRHPNYFGDFCVWWGLSLTAWTSGGAVAVSVVSPLVMSYLLIGGSGKRLLERHMADRPGYAAYRARTSGFLPRPPRRPRHHRRSDRV